MSNQYRIEQDRAWVGSWFLPDHLGIRTLAPYFELLDGRGNHNNGWFVVRALVPRPTAVTGGPPPPPVDRT